MMNEMSGNEIVREADIAALRVITYPDPRLREACAAVDEEDDRVRRLAEKMFDLMFASRGVGLAAPQVGLAVRLFVASPSFEAEDRRVYVNPRIVAADGRQEEEEGCLSFPGVACKIKRFQTVTIEAVGLDGEPFAETLDGLASRIVQHEGDHLDGRLIVDRMGAVAKLANRRALRQLEEAFAGA
jgi:peptide deformylase